MLWTIIAVLILLLLLKRVSQVYHWHPIRWIQKKTTPKPKSTKSVTPRETPLDFVDPDAKPPTFWR